MSVRPLPESKAAINGGNDEAEEAPRGGSRKKGKGMRTWLLINESGEAQVVEEGKYAIMLRTGIPNRDLRILDPMFSYPSSILGRERAIVINLEHIKAIITAHEVLLLNSKDPAVVPFVEDLQRRLPKNSNTPAQQEGGNSDVDADSSNKDNDQPFDENDFLERPGPKLEMNGFENSCPKVFPFEFRALEACLEAACSCLESETHILEEEAYPALDELTSKISTLYLERVRQIKSRLVALSGRVQKVRDELEHLLDDDDDMAEMYLTEKLMQQHLDATSSSSMFYGLSGGIDYELTKSDAEEQRYTEPQILPKSSADGVEGLRGTVNTLGRDDISSTTSSTNSVTKGLDVEELEMLLEAYFVQIDGTLNKLSALREYVDDTEDYINIMLDDKQNHLLQMGIMLTTAALIVSFFVTIAGVMGMNIKINLFKPEYSGLPQFIWTIVGSTLSSIFLYVAAIACYKYKGLLE